MYLIRSRIVVKFLLIALLLSCTRDFEEINKNPNDPTSVPTAYLITSTQRALADEIVDNYMGTLYAQHWSETFSTGESRYEEAELSFHRYYGELLSDLQNIINLNTNEDTKDLAAASGANANQIAICRILKVFIYQIVTDTWGDIPYFDALKGRENFTPKYDPQEDIYKDFLKELTEAAEQIDPSIGGIEGDIIYFGDMSKWRLFANSLKLRVGIRMTESNPDMAKSAIESAVADGVFTSNEDNALFTYLEDSQNDNPVYNDFRFGVFYAISSTMANKMMDNNDPRLYVYADPVAGTDTIVGMPYGVDEATAASIPIDSVSAPGQTVRQPTTKGIFLTYSEILFVLAEAAERGWNVGGSTAEDLYNEAIRANMEYWGMTEEEADTYLVQPNVAYDPGNFRKSIGEQKWISLYMAGIENWSEWRRLDYPELEPAPDAVEGREIPRRRAYSQLEYDFNEENVLEAIDRQGPDVMETRVWWDK